MPAEVLLRLATGRPDDDPQLVVALQMWGTPPPIGNFLVGEGVILSGENDIGTRRLVSRLLPHAPESDHSDDRSAHQALLNVWDSANYSMLFRALMSSSPDGWAIDWLVAQCASCFGTGIADQAKCGTCGGAGWGTLSSTVYRYSPRRESHLASRSFRAIA